MKDWWHKLNHDQKYTIYGVIFIVLAIGTIMAIKKITTKVEIKTETVTEEILCEHKTENAPDILKGETKVKQECVNGEKTKTYEVTYENDKEKSRDFVKEETTREMIPEIKLIGTKEETVVINESNDSSSTTRGPDGYCKDGTPAYGNRSLGGRANYCYGHGGWK